MSEPVPDIGGRDHDRCNCGHQRIDHRLRTYHCRTDCEHDGCPCSTFRKDDGWRPLERSTDDGMERR